MANALWLVDIVQSYNSASATSPTVLIEHPSVHVPVYESTESIATLRQFSPDAPALLTDLAEARMMIRTEKDVKAHDGGLWTSRVVDCAAAHDFVSRDFVRHFSL
jgi:hypothetical protein